jgi:hypothetical protein
MWAVGVREPADKIRPGLIISAESDLAQELSREHAAEVAAFIEAPRPAVAPGYEVDLTRFDGQGNLR